MQILFSSGNSAWTQRIWNYFQTISIAAIFCLTWIPAEHTQENWSWWITYFANGLVILALVLLLVLWRPTRWILDLANHWLGGIRIAEWQWLTVTAAFMLGLCCYLSWSVFERLPANPDSYAYYIHGKIFALGKFYTPSPPFAHFFDTQWFINDGKFYSKYPPGHPMVMAPFHLLGAPWLTNPVMGAVSLVLIYYLAKEIGTAQTARIASILTLCSPFIAFMSAEYLNHITAMACATGFALFYIRAHKRKSIKSAALAGLLLGFLLITRPQVALPFGFPFALHWLLTARHGLLFYWKAGGVMLAAFGFWALFFLYYNWQTTGDPFLTGYRKYHALEELVGRRFLNWKIFRMEGDLWRMRQQLHQFHTRLFAWPTSSLLLVWFLFQLHMAKRYCGLLVIACLLVAISLIPVPFHGGGFSPRYLFEISGVCIALTALCLSRIPAWLRHHTHARIKLSTLRWSTYLGILLLVLFAFPYQINTLMDEYRYFASVNFGRGGNPPYRHQIPSLVKTPALIFFGGYGTNYFTGSLFHPPLPDAPIIAARDKGVANQRLMNRYPERYIYGADDYQVYLYRTPLEPKP